MKTKSLCSLLALSALASQVAAGAPQTVAPSGSADPLSEIIVETPEPRFVASTRRDKIGRIWAPVLINGRGPFRLVLDTGANRSAITTRVAQDLGITPDRTRPAILRGVTGNMTVPTVSVESFAVGMSFSHPRRSPSWQMH